MGRSFGAVQGNSSSFGFRFVDCLLQYEKFFNQFLSLGVQFKSSFLLSSSFVFVGWNYGTGNPLHLVARLIKAFPK